MIWLCRRESLFISTFYTELSYLTATTYSSMQYMDFLPESTTVCNANAYNNLLLIPFIFCVLQINDKHSVASPKRIRGKTESTHSTIPLTLFYLTSYCRSYCDYTELISSVDSLVWCQYCFDMFQKHNISHISPIRRHT